jgi:hypothetical protein
MDIPQHIFFMTKAKESLEKLSINDQDFEYHLILNYIIEYLKKNCRHNVIKDTIDITPDDSKTISYCEYCELSFD